MLDFVVIAYLPSVQNPLFELMQNLCLSRNTDNSPLIPILKPSSEPFSLKVYEGIEMVVLDEVFLCLI